MQFFGPNKSRNRSQLVISEAYYTERWVLQGTFLSSILINHIAFIFNHRDGYISRLSLDTVYYSLGKNLNVFCVDVNKELEVFKMQATLDTIFFE